MIQMIMVTSFLSKRLTYLKWFQLISKWTVLEIDKLILNMHKNLKTMPKEKNKKNSFAVKKKNLKLPKVYYRVVKKIWLQYKLDRLA